MKIIKNISFDFWWQIAENCPYATFFHSPLWHQLIEETYDKKNTPIGGIGENGTKMILPLLETGSTTIGLFRNYVSTFAGCYGGIIADGPVNKKDSEELYQEILKMRTGSFQLNGNPLWQMYNEKNWFDDEVDKDTKEDFTHILDLNSDMGDIISGFSQGHRTSLRKGKKMGVKVRVADSLEDYKAYFGAYVDSLRRWGDNATSRYPWELFKNGYELEKKYPQHIKLWLATVEEQVVAGAWTFYWNYHIDWWHGAAYETYFDHYPNNVLIPEIIKHGIENDYQYFDFNPSGGHEGVISFKEHFDAAKWPIVRIQISGNVKSVIDKFRMALSS